MLSTQSKNKKQPNKIIGHAKKEKNTNTSKKLNKNQEIFINFFRNDILLHKL
jgi:hypothetical protein